MKIKTKALRCICAVTVLGLLAAFIAMMPRSAGNAEAETIRVPSYADNFDAETLDPSAWQTTGGVEKKNEYSALRMDSINMWGGYVVYQKRQLSAADEGFTVEFDADWLNTKSGWTGIFFGNSSYTSMFTGSNYFLHISTGADTATSGSDESGRGMRLSPKMTGSTAFESTYGKSHFHTSDVWKKGDISEGGKPVHIKLRFDRAPETTDKHILTFSWRYTDVDSYDDANVYVFDKQPMNVNGYMGFTTYGTTLFELRSFTFQKDGEDPVSESFDASEISYPSLPSPSAAWRCVSVTEANVYCGAICSVGFEGAPNGTLVYTGELAENEYCSKNFELSYTVSLSGMTESTYIGSAFGLGSLDASAKSADFIGFRKDGGKYKVAHFKNGVMAGKETEFSASGLDVEIGFFGKYGKTVEFYVNGNRIARFSDTDFNGITAIASFTEGDGTGCTATVDNFELYKYETVFADNGDYRIDFKGRRSRIFPDGSNNDEFWFNTRKWVRFGEISEPYIINENSNYLMFRRVRSEAGFAPRAQFGDFIARFDFQASSLEDNSIKLSPIGLSFGRENLASDAASAPGIFFEPTYTEHVDENKKVTYEITGTRVTGANITTESGTTGFALDAEYHVFGDSRTWWTCMVVMSNRTAKVYLKKAGVGGEDFGPALATFTDVDAHGYVAVTHKPSGSNFAYYRMTNVSVIGTDLLQSADASPANSDAAVRGDFKGGNSEGWTLSEFAVSSSDGIQTIASGKVTSADEFRNFIVQLSFGSLTKGFELSFGECVMRFDGAKVELTGLKTRSEENSFMLNDFISGDSIIQVEVIGRQAAVSIKGKDDPYDALGTPVAVLCYEDGLPITSKKVSVSAFEGSSFLLESANVYSLNATVEIETEHYTAPEPKPDDGNGEKKGCGCKSAAYSLGIASAGLALAGAATVLLIARRSKNEKNG